jgi:glycosyltransferase involved in cell wall biosynthesis
LRRARAIPGLRLVITLHEFLAICFNHGQMITPVTNRLCEGASPAACATCFPNHSRQDFVLRKTLFHETLSSFDQLISPSWFLAQRFCEWGLDEAKMFVVENGLAHAPASRPTPAIGRRGEWVFGYFGQINPFKGVDVILEAAELLKKERIANLRIRIHGNLVGQSDAFCERLKETCAQGLVAYSGPYDNAQVHRLMAECDYVIVPSRWWENSPVVIQEAYAAGCPVLCTGVGGLAEKVKAGVSGLHFRLGDAADLARGMIDAASEDTHRRLLKGLPKPFGAFEMARRYLEVFATTNRPKLAATVISEGDAQAVDFA